MLNIMNDDIGDSGSDINFHHNTNAQNTNDDEKKPTINYSMSSSHNRNMNDLRSNPPPSGSKLYQSSSGSKFDQIIGNIERVKESVKENIEMAIDRHENMALLQSKTDRLADESINFRNRSRTLHYKYCRDLYKQRCVVIVIIVFVIYLLSAMICGWGWDSC